MLMAILFLMILIVSILILILAELKSPRDSEYLLQREILLELREIRTLLQKRTS